MAQYEQGPEAKSLETGFALDELLRKQRADATQQARQLGATGGMQAAQTESQNRNRLEQMMLGEKLKEQGADREASRVAPFLQNMMTNRPDVAKTFGMGTTQQVPGELPVAEAGYAGTPATSKWVPPTLEQSQGLAKAVPGIATELLKQAGEQKLIPVAKDSGLYDPNTREMLVDPNRSDSTTLKTREQAMAEAEAIHKTDPSKQVTISGNPKDGWSVAQHITPQPNSVSIAMAMPDDRLDPLVHSWATTGIIPTGIGRSPVMVDKFLKRAAELYPGLDAGATQAAFKSNLKGLEKNATIRSQVEPFTQTIQKEMSILGPMFAELENSRSPLLNLGVNKIMTAAGDPRYTQAASQMNLIRTEVAKVLTSTTGAGGVVSDSARKEILPLLNENMSPAQFKRAMILLKRDLDFRKQSLDQEEQMGMGRVHPIYRKGYGAGANPTDPDRPKTPEELFHDKFNKKG